MRRPRPILAALFCICTLCAAFGLAVPARGGAQGGVPQAVWQDSDHHNRRSPAQFTRQLRRPNVRADRNLVRAHGAAENAQSEPTANGLAQPSQSRRAARTQGMLATGAAPLAAPGSQLAMPQSIDWRLRIMPAAVARGDQVLLGEIALPIGPVPDWESLRNAELWPAPPEEGKPLQVNRARLSDALHERLGKDTASRCILPASLAIQRGGVLVREEDLRAYVVNSLTPNLRAMPGEAELTDFHLPEYIFLAHAGQRIQLEPPRLLPGRVPLRFALLEADGTVIRRVSATISLTQWVTVPSAAHPLARGDALTPDAVTFIRINAKRLRDTPWDGQGGPWKMQRNLAQGEPILQSDLASQSMIRRGQIVGLIYARGNLRLTTQVEALADGEPGATIPVRNLQTKKQVFATVRDGNTVEIH
ncbi:MAG: flagellar basal body P-ring formation protein FlgA [Desulfovibrio sp.]|nr:flagellar basal body P-ring formation protein FlgA [Desulfovibrio sp.]